MPRALPALHVTINGLRVDAETVAQAGPDTLTLTTTLAAHGLTLTTTYLGDGRGRTLIGVLERARIGARIDASWTDAAELPVTHARGRCLLDHAARLHALAQAQVTSGVCVDVTDHALAAADALAAGAD